MFATTAWTIWNQRSQICLHQNCYTTNQLSQVSKDHVVEFLAISPARIPPTRQTWVTWKPSPLDSFKINYDGAIFCQDNKSRIGVIIRDNCGMVINALAQIPQAYQVEEVEAMAAIRALEFRTKVGVSNVIVEGDSEVVVKALQHDNPSLASHECLLKDACLFTSFYSKLLYSHTKKDGNKVAHSLAKMASNSPGCVMWMEDVPPPIFFVLQANMTIQFQ